MQGMMNFSINKSNIDECLKICKHMVLGNIPADANFLFLVSLEIKKEPRYKFASKKIEHFLADVEKETRTGLSP